MKKEIEVTIPSTPNFIKVGEEMLSITEFNEHELNEIGAAWTKALVEKMKTRNNHL